MRQIFNNPKITIISVVFVVFLAIVALLLTPKTNQPEPSLKPVQTPPPIQPIQPSLPTPRSTDQNPLTLTRIRPDLSINKKVHITEQIEVTFNQPIKPETLNYLVTPNIAIEVVLDSTKTNLSIQPQKYWPISENIKITINSNLQSESGGTLQNNIIIEFAAGSTPTEGL